MSNEGGSRNTVGTALAPPESTSSHRLGTYQTLTEAFACVRRARRNRGIKAVGITSYLHISLKVAPDMRPLIGDEDFERFVHWFGPLYQFHHRFEVRMEEIPQVSDHKSSVHPRMALIICLNQGEKLEDITDIKEQ